MIHLDLPLLLILSFLSDPDHWMHVECDLLLLTGNDPDHWMHVGHSTDSVLIVCQIQIQFHPPSPLT